MNDFGDALDIYTVIRHKRVNGACCVSDLPLLIQASDKMQGEAIKDEIRKIFEAAEWASDKDRDEFYDDMISGPGGWSKIGADGKRYHVPAFDIYKKD